MVVPQSVQLLQLLQGGTGQRARRETGDENPSSPLSETLSAHRYLGAVAHASHPNNWSPYAYGAAVYTQQLAQLALTRRTVADLTVGTPSEIRHLLYGAGRVQQSVCMAENRNFGSSGNVSRKLAARLQELNVNTVHDLLALQKGQFEKLSGDTVSDDSTLAAANPLQHMQDAYAALRREFYELCFPLSGLGDEAPFNFRQARDTRISAPAQSGFVLDRLRAAGWEAEDAQAGAEAATVAAPTLLPVAARKRNRKAKNGRKERRRRVASALRKVTEGIVMRPSVLHKVRIRKCEVDVDNPSVADSWSLIRRAVRMSESEDRDRNPSQTEDEGPAARRVTEPPNPGQSRHLTNPHALDPELAPFALYHLGGTCGFVASAVVPSVQKAVYDDSEVLTRLEKLQKRRWHDRR